MRRFVVDLQKVDPSVKNPFLNHVNLRYRENYYYQRNGKYIPENIFKFPRAETLQLYNCSIQLDFNWDKAINSLKSLKEFEIKECHFTIEKTSFADGHNRFKQFGIHQKLWKNIGRR
jgi:hypothetical protein